MTTSFTRRNTGDVDIQPVAIQSVDPTSRIAQCMTRLKYLIPVDCSFAMGETTVVPAVGEQWYIERIDQTWRLRGRIPHLDETLLIEPEEGQVSVGGTKGPLELNGKEIRVNGVMRLGDTFYRDADGVLQHSADQDVWIPVAAPAGSGGVTSSDAVPEGVVHKYFTVARAAAAAPVQKVAGRIGNVVLTKSDVGLAAADNTSDLDKPISSAVANALGVKADLVNGTVPASQLPVKVTTYANLAAFPSSGAQNALYVSDSNHFVYYWNGTGYVLTGGGGGGGGSGLSSTDDLPEGTSNLYFTTARASAAAPVQDNDARLTNTRAPSPGSVTLGTLSSAVAAALAASPYDVSYPQCLGPRAIGLGQATIGVRLARPVVFTEVTYRCGTADASNQSTFELRRNGASITESAATIPAANQVAGVTVTGSWAFAQGDILTVYISAVGNTPGNGLVADLKGNA